MDAQDAIPPETQRQENSNTVQAEETHGTTERRQTGAGRAATWEAVAQEYDHILVRGVNATPATGPQ
eukprot:11212297-Lingulodinium_polyedra.AAC.1